MTASKLKIARDGFVAVLTLSDPSTMNSVEPDVLEELMAALKNVVAGDQPARAIVLTGEGRGFCSGANLAALAPRDVPRSEVHLSIGELMKRYINPLILMMRDLPVPFVTAVNGAAAGLGCSFALMGDLIVAAENAYFLQAFRRIGLTPDGGSSYLLPRMIGRARAMEMTLLGERLPAVKALEWGLINRCVPDAELMPTALGLAHELAAGPKSLGLIRRTMWAGLDTEFADQLAFERETQMQAAQTEDHAEGVQAFVGKRKAVFQGR